MPYPITLPVVDASSILQSSVGYIPSDVEMSKYWFASFVYCVLFTVKDIEAIESVQPFNVVSQSDYLISIVLHDLDV